MSFLGHSKIHLLFPEDGEDTVKMDPIPEPEKTEAFIVVEPKQVDPVDWDETLEFPRDKEAIQQNRDWILEETNDKYAPSPSDVEKYSPYDKDKYQGVQKWMQEHRPPMPSQWVEYAQKELERTGARRAIPSGFSSGNAWDKGDTIYVGLPDE